MGKDEDGIAGDPWTPSVLEGNTATALSIEGRGCNFRRLSAILTGDEGRGGGPMSSQRGRAETIGTKGPFRAL
jgi:hypothetical protein